jgi:ATP-dependent Clp protease ATP-binding subunit ClpB
MIPDKKTILKIAEIEKVLKDNIIGQDTIIPTIAGQLGVGETYLADEKRPKGIFLFLGTTGVGKTETAITFSDYLFGPGKFFRFDMSEFMHIDAVKSMIGAETGGDSGRLGCVLEKHQEGVLLFDEMEKSHPKILDLFLQIFDAARITTNDGVTHSLKNFYIVLTSNIGASSIVDSDGAMSSSIESAIISELENALRMEFINRIPERCIFRMLTPDDQNKIARLIFKKELKRLAVLGHNLTYDESAFEHCIRTGINVKMGVRPLRDTIVRYCTRAVAKHILETHSHASGCLTFNPDKYCFEISK